MSHQALIRRVRHPNLWKVLRYRSVLVRALSVRVGEHLTERCACEFCHVYRAIVSHEPEPVFDEDGEYVA